MRRGLKGSASGPIIGARRLFSQVASAHMIPDGLPRIPQYVAQHDVVPLGRKGVSIRLYIQMLAHDLLGGKIGIDLDRIDV